MKATRWYFFILKNCILKKHTFNEKTKYKKIIDQYYHKISGFESMYNEIDEHQWLEEYNLSAVVEDVMPYYAFLLYNPQHKGKFNLNLLKKRILHK